MKSPKSSSRFLPKALFLGLLSLGLGLLLSFSLVSSPEDGKSSKSESKKASVESALKKKATNHAQITIRGKAFTEDDLRNDPKYKKQFYELDKQHHDILVGIAREKFMEAFWAAEAKKQKTSVDKAMEAYVDRNVKIGEKEIATIMEQIKDQPSFKNMPEKEKLSQVKNYLKSQATRSLFEKILTEAEKNKDLTYPVAPEEPRYPILLTDSDHLRYGPGVGDTKPVKCKGNDCPIVVVEYSEFQCPFCKRALDSIKQVLSDKNIAGKIVWTMRHYPLPFHKDAVPAAMAATCAGEQGKFWPMYYELFTDTKNLKPEAFKNYATNVSLDMKKFDTCMASQKTKAFVEAQRAEADSLYDVKGTPAFFINGRKLSGALPASEFMRVINEELRLVEGKSSKEKAKL